MSKDKKTEEDKEIKIGITKVAMIVLVLVLIIIFLIHLYKEEANKIKILPDGQGSEPIKITEFNEEEAISLLSQYLEERSLAYSNPQALLEKYSFATNQEFSNFEKTSDEQFLRTNILYEDIRNEMQKYITKEFFSKQFKNIYKQSNGITHVSVANSPKIEYKITRHELIDKSNKILIDVWYTTTTDKVTSEEKNMNVEFSKVNETWIISNIK